MDKSIQDYINEKNLGLSAEELLRHFMPIAEEIKRSAFGDFLALDFSHYQKLDNTDVLAIQLRVRMVEEIIDGLNRQIVNGESAKNFIKEHHEKNG